LFIPFNCNRFFLFDYLLEPKTQAKIQRVQLVRAPESRLTRSVITEPRKVTSPPQTNLPNNQTDSMKPSFSNNIPFTSPFQTSKPSPYNVAIDSELDVWSFFISIFIDQFFFIYSYTSYGLEKQYVNNTMILFNYKNIALVI